MMFVRKRRLRAAMMASSWFAGFVVAVAAIASHSAGAEESRPLSPPAAAPSAGALVPAPFRPARPYWLELTLAQREALAPLSADWERLDAQTKKKWVEIGNRYPQMKPEEQTRTRDRMREWAMLTPEQRRVARDSFARIQSMPPEQRAEMLRKYQELPPEKRQALAVEGKATKPLVVPKAMPAPTTRRTQIREGAKVGNPAVAAQKSDSPIVAPARPRPAAPAPAAPTAVVAEQPAATPAGAAPAP